MIETITAVNQAVNQFIWGVPAMVCIIGVGLLLSVRTGFLQIRKFPYAIKTTIGRMFHKKDASDGAMTPFQAVCTALAGTVGTGNIAGVAGAIAIGGPGAVFWMWCSALLGMCTKFAEVTLAVHYRERSETGEWVGGPMYYIKNGLSKHWQFLAVLYSLFGVLTVFGTGNATQVNTIVAAIDTALLEYGVVGGGALSTLNLVVGIAVAMLVAMVLLGGIKRIGSVSEKLVPFMALFYIVLSVGVMVLNFERLPYVFESIIAGAFNPAAFTGGTIGSLFVSMQKGVSRGIFSNEAGLGTGSIAHACADTKKPVKQGMFGIFEVFADTIVICTLTAMVILCSGTTVNYGTAAGAELTISGFTTTYGGWASIFTAVALCCFAFSTIIGWGLYGSRFLVFLCRSDKVAKPFFLVYSFVSILGATMDLGLLWSIADTFNGLMSIPNLLALLLLSGTVVRLTKEFFASEADCPQQKEAAALSAKTMCNSLFCYSGRCTGTRATQCTRQSPSLRVFPAAGAGGAPVGGLQKASRPLPIKSIQKILYETRNFFRAKTAPKRFRVFDSSQFSCAGCYRIFSIPLFCPRPALFNPDSSCYNIH